MCGLDHVRSVDVVVVGHVCVVMILQSHHEGDEGVRGNLKGLQQLTFLRWQRAEASQGTCRSFIKNLLVTSLRSFIDCLVYSFANTNACGYTVLECVTWKMVYMVTVSGRFPEYSEILKMSIPHLFMSSISCRWTTRAEVTTPYSEREIKTKHTDQQMFNKPSYSG